MTAPLRRTLVPLVAALLVAAPVTIDPPSILSHPRLEPADAAAREGKGSGNNGGGQGQSSGNNSNSSKGDGKGNGGNNGNAGNGGNNGNAGNGGGNGGGNGNGNGRGNDNRDRKDSPRQPREARPEPGTRETAEERVERRRSGSEGRSIGEGSRPERAEGEMVATGLSRNDIAQLHARGYRVRQTVGEALGAPVIRLALPEGVTPTAAREQIASVNGAATAAENTYYYPEAGPAACTGPQCAGARLVGWTSVRSESCGALPLIGLVDTGINAGHEALRGQRIEIITERGGAGEASTEIHGTAVAALLVGRADSRTPGLLPNARVVAVDAFYRDGGTDDRTDVATLVRAIELLAERGVTVLNLSLSGPPNAVLEAAIAAAVARDIVVISAAGNQGAGAPPAYPGAYPGVIAVTAVDRKLGIYARANRGDYVDIAAPGVDIWTAASIRGGRPKTGTSFAVPFVTAGAALLRASNPALTADAIAARLEASARDLGPTGRDPVFGAGLVRADALCPAGGADDRREEQTATVSGPGGDVVVPASE